MGQADEKITKDVPEILFVCVHNAGRSQMAAGLLNKLADGRVHVRTAGSDPSDEINPAAVEAMAEVGVDLGQEFPKPLNDEFVRAADAVITMGCGDACPIYPGKRYEDWELEDPAGQDVETRRRIRDEIEERVRRRLATSRRCPSLTCCGGGGRGASQRSCSSSPARRPSPTGHDGASAWSGTGSSRLVTMVMVYVTCAPLGAHINPVVTVAFTLTRALSRRASRRYVAAQPRAVVAGALVLLVAGDRPADLGRWCGASAL